MVRTSKLVVALVVVLGSGGILAAYTGNAEPYVSQSAVPGPPPYGFGAVVGLVVGGAVVVGLLDRRAWKRAGGPAGLSSRGPTFPVDPPQSSSGLFSTPRLTGTVDGRPVQARTYTTGGGGEHSSSTTYTVVEAALDHPVEWTGTFAATPGSLPDRDGPDLGTAPEAVEALGPELGQVREVDGGLVWGEVPAEVASDVLSGRARETLARLDDGVSVGDVSQAAAAGMHDALAEADDSATASVAQGLLSLAGGDEPAGPARAVRHREEGLCLDADELQRRAAAVVAVAGAVERATDGRAR